MPLPGEPSTRKALGPQLGWPSSFFVLEGLPVAEKTYPFKELYIEAIIRNPKKVGLFGYRYP